ncbi:MAG: hypothetical protein AAGN64_18295 [Bacteroidota bacterium]
MDNETALADAELEYQDREDLSVYVDFECADADDVYARFGLDADSRPDAAPSVMIWTTTPWTLPSNLALAVGEDIDYAYVRHGDETLIVASALRERVFGDAEHSVEKTVKGTELVGKTYIVLKRGNTSLNVRASTW